MNQLKDKLLANKPYVVLKLILNGNHKLVNGLLYAKSTIFPTPKLPTCGIHHIRIDKLNWAGHSFEHNDLRSIHYLQLLLDSYHKCVIFIGHKFYGDFTVCKIFINYFFVIRIHSNGRMYNEPPK